MKKANPLSRYRWLPELMALMGGGLYLIQSWIYAHTQDSVLDEGLYLLKGYLFANGKYHPFQDYGPWTNHMPFSFLIPGYIQVWFGPGLYTSRLFSIVLGLLFLLGFWIIVKRFGSRWWAALAIWVVALNPAVIKIYSVMTSQVLVICLLMWIFVLSLGADRRLWQVILGAVLAGLLPLTRLNLIPLLPLLLVYILWEHGIKRGAWAVIAGFLSFGLGHAYFWPGILRLWASWLPSALTPFLDGWRRVGGGNGIWDPKVTTDGRFVSFFEGVRYHFVSIISMVAAFFMWFDLRKKGRKLKEFKTIVFLTVFFIAMIGFHTWASLFKNYCVFCFSSYLSFFVFTGFLIFVMIFSSWVDIVDDSSQKWRWLVVFLISLGIGYSAQRTLGQYPFMDRMIDAFFSFPIPRVKEGDIQSGTINWLGLLNNKMGWDYVKTISRAHLIFYLVFSIFIGVVGTWFVLRVYLHLKDTNKFLTRFPTSLGSSVLIAFLILGMLLSPTAFLGGGRDFYDCNQDVIQSYEQNGAYLAEIIPSGSKVYWKGGLALAVLLYLPDVYYYPAQFNAVYSYRDGGDSEELRKFGLWNDSLARRWAAEADFILISERSNFDNDWIRTYVESDRFSELAITSPLNPCEANTTIRIFQRLP